MKQKLLNFLSKVYIKIFKSDNLDEEVTKLKTLKNDKLIKEKYDYIIKSKQLTNTGNAIKNFSVISTILISITGIIISTTMQFNDNAVKQMENVLSQKIEIIKYEEITNDEKAKKMNEVYNDYYSDENLELIIGIKTYETVIKIAAFIGIIGIIVSLILLIIARLSYDKAAMYEVLIKYIDDELLKDIS